VAVNFEYAPGATPLDPDEAAGLVPKHITHQGDLNAWEQANIFQADRWAARLAPTKTSRNAPAGSGLSPVGAGLPANVRLR